MLLPSVKEGFVDVAEVIWLSVKKTCCRGKSEVKPRIRKGFGGVWEVVHPSMRNASSVRDCFGGVVEVLG